MCYFKILEIKHNNSTIDNNEMYIITNSLLCIALLLLQYVKMIFSQDVG